MQYTAPSVEGIVEQMQELARLEVALERKQKPFQKKMDALLEDQAEKSGDLPDRIKSLEESIKRDCLLRGSSVLTDTPYDVIWSAGRVTWDGRALDGYAVANPDIGRFRKEGKPSAKLARKKA